MRAAPSPASADLTDPVVARVVHLAQVHFFAHGYCQCTMADLARELGMSKKTLYVHFSGKEEIMRAVIEQLSGEIRTEAETLLADRSLGFAAKLRGFAEVMGRRLTRLNPRTLRDLQRFAPDLHQLIVELRQKNIPYIFGRLITAGQQSGKVRRDLDVTLTVEFFLQAVQGLMQPANLERLNLTPAQMLPRAIDLFFGGLLTPAGRKEHEKLFPR